jgi:hypothetical protein
MHGDPTHRVRNDAPDSTFPAAPLRKGSSRVVVLAIVLGSIVLAAAVLFRVLQLGDGASLATFFTDATPSAEPSPIDTTPEESAPEQTSEAR